MKSPKDQKIIQIEITNVCAHRCSNCTRFCGHHAKPFHMDFDTFKKAVGSLKGYPGMIGIMGGEPTLHPEFERFVEYYRGRIEPGRSFSLARLPLTDFAEHTEENLAFVPSMRRGLWTSLGNKYYEHFELIQDTFPYQCINDHANPGLHQALLVARKDLDIPDDEWIKLRDNCWIQNLWSGAITPKGAFFCEVAAALDMLFNGPGGWPLDPGWWKRTPREFGDQLQWCELCGAALQTPRRRANEEIDDVSPSLLKKLKAIDSPKLRLDRVRVVESGYYRPDENARKPSNEWYLPDEDNALRVSGTNRTLYPRAISAVVIGHVLTALNPLITAAAEEFDRVIAAISGAEAGSESLQAAEICHVPGGTREKLLCRALDMLRPEDWVVVLDEDTVLERGFGRQLRNWILNPGCVYEFKRDGYPGERAGTLVRANTVRAPDDLRGAAFCSIFNVRAQALRARNPDRFTFDLWPKDKRIDMNAFLLNPDPLAERRRLGREMARHVLSVWRVLNGCGCRVTLFGAGHHTRWLLGLLKSHDLPMPVMLIDDDPYAAEIEGIDVVQPGKAETNAFDTVVISVDPGPMTRILSARCREIWGDSKKIVELYRGYPEGRFMKLRRNDDKRQNHDAVAT